MPDSFENLYLKQFYSALNSTTRTANERLTNRSVQRLKANLKQTFIDCFAGHEPAKNFKRTFT